MLPNMKAVVLQSERAAICPERANPKAHPMFFGDRPKGEMERWLSQAFLFFLLLCDFFATTTSFNLPSHGCYWTESCQSNWFGGCGSGHDGIDKSNDCHGLCPESQFPPCLPFYSHFHCCIPESPKITSRCTQCKNKIDYGDKYICCTDCSDPYLTEKNAKFGYCKTGAELAMQLKPQEVFRWVAGPWMKCSSPCDGGVKYRDVGCFGSIEDASIVHYPVDDTKCSKKEMPTRQEPCNVRSCGDFNDVSIDQSKDSGMSVWLVTLLSFLGLAAFGCLGFVGYTYYKRRTSTHNGFVYIMLEGYS